MKTLDCLRNLSTNDAELFVKVSKYIISDCMLYNDDDINKKYNIMYADVLTLDECGLINSSGAISISYNIDHDKKLIIDFGAYCLFAYSDNNQIVSFSNYPLTRAGRELLSVARNEVMDEQYVREIVNKMKDRYHNVQFDLYKVKERFEDGVKVEENNIDL